MKSMNEYDEICKCYNVICKIIVTNKKGNEKNI